MDRPVLSLRRPGHQQPERLPGGLHRQTTREVPRATGRHPELALHPGGAQAVRGAPGPGVTSRRLVRGHPGQRSGMARATAPCALCHLQALCGSGRQLGTGTRPDGGRGHHAHGHLRRGRCLGQALHLHRVLRVDAALLQPSRAVGQQALGRSAGPDALSRRCIPSEGCRWARLLADLRLGHVGHAQHDAARL